MCEFTKLIIDPVIVMIYYDNDPTVKDLKYFINLFNILDILLINLL